MDEDDYYHSGATGTYEFKDPNISFMTERGEYVRANLRLIYEIEKERQELEKLCEEIPGIKELYDQLQMAIRLYRE